jgi:hypothetical protein
MEDNNIEQQSKKSYLSFKSQLEKKYSLISKTNWGKWQAFQNRIEIYFPQLFRLYFQLFGTHPNFNFHFDDLMKRITQSWIRRGRPIPYGFNPTRCWGVFVM